MSEVRAGGGCGRNCELFSMTQGLIAPLVLSIGSAVGTYTPGDVNGR
jgi:hypothetical protein